MLMGCNRGVTDLCVRSDGPTSANLYKLGLNVTGKRWALRVVSNKLFRGFTFKKYTCYKQTASYFTHIERWCINPLQDCVKQLLALQITITENS